MSVLCKTSNFSIPPVKTSTSSLFPLPKMPKGEKAKGKKVAPAPAVVKKQEAKKKINPLFEKRPKDFGIGHGHPAQKGSHSLCQMSHSAAAAKGYSL